MKNAFLTILILVSAAAAAQALNKDSQHPSIAGKLFYNDPVSKEKIMGSPYFQPAFAKATVVNIKVEAYLRYNIYTDEFQFITPKNDTLVLDKIEDFGNIEFPGLKKRYNLVAYTSGKKLVYGYLLNLYEKDGFTLYKKENIGLTEAKIAETRLEKSTPASYNKLKDAFFFKNKEAVVAEFPDSKKALIKLFPDKKAAIEGYLKENKTDFDSEVDLIKVIDFLAK